MSILKQNQLKTYQSTVSPTVNDDSANGFIAGSLWSNTTSGNTYICRVDSVGAAVWALLPDSTNFPQVGNDIFHPALNDTIFNLSDLPYSDDSLLLTLNGQKRQNGIDYTLAGSTVTWLNPSGLTLGPPDVIIANYNFQSIIVPHETSRGYMTATRTTNQGLPQNTLEKIHFDEQFSADGWRRDGFGFRPIEAGTYYISIDWVVDNTSAIAQHYTTFYIYVNGDVHTPSHRFTGGAPTLFALYYHMQAILEVKTSDVVYFQGYAEDEDTILGIRTTPATFDRFTFIATANINIVRSSK